MGNRLSKIYTRTGDDGTTGLGDGSRVAKESLRVEAYGSVDETNSAIGVVLGTAALPPEIRRCLTEVQHDLFDLGGELCIPGNLMIGAAHVERLEKQLDGFNAALPPLNVQDLVRLARVSEPAVSPDGKIGRASCRERVCLLV